MLTIFLGVAVVFLLAGRYLDREDLLKEKSEKARLQTSNEIYESELQRTNCLLDSVSLKLQSKIVQDDSLTTLTAAQDKKIKFYESQNKKFNSDHFASVDNNTIKNRLSGIKFRAKD